MHLWNFFNDIPKKLISQGSLEYVRVATLLPSSHSCLTSELSKTSHWFGYLLPSLVNGMTFLAMQVSSSIVLTLASYIWIFRLLILCLRNIVSCANSRFSFPHNACSPSISRTRFSHCLHVLPSHGPIAADVACLITTSNTLNPTYLIFDMSSHMPQAMCASARCRLWSLCSTLGIMG